MNAATSFTCRKQVVDVEQQVILEKHKFYINRQKYFCPLRRVIDFGGLRIDGRPGTRGVFGCDKGVSFEFTLSCSLLKREERR